MTIQIQMCFMHLNLNPLNLWTQDMRKWSWIGPISSSAFFLCVSWNYDLLKLFPQTWHGQLDPMCPLYWEKNIIILKKLWYFWQCSDFNISSHMNSQIHPKHYVKFVGKFQDIRKHFAKTLKLFPCLSPLTSVYVT